MKTLFILVYKGVAYILGGLAGALALFAMAGIPFALMVGAVYLIGFFIDNPLIGIPAIISILIMAYFGRRFAKERNIDIW